MRTCSYTGNAVLLTGAKGLMLMANLQQRLDDLQQKLRDLANRAGREDISQAVNQLEPLARALLADAKNTPQERLRRRFSPS